MSPPSLRINARAFLPMVLITACDGAASDAPDRAGDAVRLSIDLAPRVAAVGDSLGPIVVRAFDADERPVPGLGIEVAAVAGSSTAKTFATTDVDGATPPLNWQLGYLPVANHLTVVAGDLVASTDVLPVEGPTPRSSDFGRVHDYMETAGLLGSTEDLAFGPDDQLVIGVPGALLALDPSGAIARIETTGATLDKPLGLAFDDSGRLWIADVDAEAVVRMERDHHLVTVATGFGERHFAGPNDIAVAPGRVFVSDPCMRSVFSFDHDGTPLGAVDLTFTRGGPNGVAVAPDGALWVTTENLGLFCKPEGVDTLASVAGLYRVPVAADGSFGAPEAIATDIALFGDGLTFDGAGNLYAIFDTVKDGLLDESIVYVLRPGERTLRRGLAARGRIWANLAFGRGRFGESLYLALLAVPFFTDPTARGVERALVGPSFWRD